MDFLDGQSVNDSYRRPSLLFPLLLLAVLLCAAAAKAQAPPDGAGVRPKTLGQFDGHGDVGPTVKRGAATYDEEKQEYTVAGSGANMWLDRDEFHFVWKRMKGNFIVRTRAQFVGRGVDAHRKVGWIVRPSLEPNSPHANATVHGDGLTSLQFRRRRAARPRK